MFSLHILNFRDQMAYSQSLFCAKRKNIAGIAKFAIKRITEECKNMRQAYVLDPYPKILNSLAHVPKIFQEIPHSVDEPLILPQLKGEPSEKSHHTVV